MKIQIKIWCIMMLGLFSSTISLNAQRITVTDIVGRKVTLNAPAKRVILGEGRSLLTLSLLHPNPISIVTGWTGDFQKSGGNIYQEYLKQYPDMAKIPVIGATGKETVSGERIISLKPDLAIFGSGSHGPDAKSADLIRQLEAAGIPIIFIDFRLHPFKNTVPSIELLGKVLGRQKQATEYLTLYKNSIAKISKRLAGKNIQRPKVYFEMIRGEAIGSPGKGNLGEFIDFAGGHNIGADILPGEVGTLNMEYVIRQQPDVYIASGIATPGQAGLVIGYGISPAETQQSLAKISAKSVLSPLKAIKDKKVYAMWHLFYDSPVNIVAMEAIAKWIHPDLFKDLNPEATLKTINEKFLAVPFKGTYLAELK